MSFATAIFLVISSVLAGAYTEKKFAWLDRSEFFLEAFIYRVINIFQK